MKKLMWIITNISFLIICIYSTAQTRNMKSRQEWEEFFEKRNSVDYLEGIYGVNVTTKRTISIGNESKTDESSQQNIYEYIIVKKEKSDRFYDVYINSKDWREDGNIANNPVLNSVFESFEILNEKITVSPTAISGVFLLSISQKTKYKNKTESTNESYNLIEKSPGLLEYIENKNVFREVNGHQFTLREVSSYLLLKNFPAKNAGFNSSLKSSGTCFAIGTEGFLVTNSHVVNNKRRIFVKGINGNLEEAFEAIIVQEDLELDIAILKIIDTRFRGFKKSPIVISPSLSDIGTPVYVLGYPLRATMGEEIKLTNGIISSHSGFKNNTNSYQISAPVHPGSSGGPVFDNNGLLIGIINAKHRGAENATYAIKVAFLKDLLNNLYLKPKLPTINTLRDKPLAEQIKELRGFVFIIESD